MRYTRIEIEGDNGNSATLARQRGNDDIEVKIITPTGTWEHRAYARDQDALWRTAEPLRAKLGGFVPDYKAVLDLLAD